MFQKHFLRTVMISLKDELKFNRIRENLSLTPGTAAAGLESKDISANRMLGVPTTVCRYLRFYLTQVLVGWIHQWLQTLPDFSLKDFSYLAGFDPRAHLGSSACCPSGHVHGQGGFSGPLPGRLDPQCSTDGGPSPRALERKANPGRALCQVHGVKREVYFHANYFFKFVGFFSL